MKRETDTIEHTHTTKAGYEVTLSIPATREVCDTCRGRGHIVNPAVDGNGLTREDFEDEDFREGYFGGRYDITCPECHGANVVKVPDVAACTTPRLKAELALYERDQENHARWDAEDRYTRWAEGGYRE